MVSATDRPAVYPHPLVEEFYTLRGQVGAALSRMSVIMSTLNEENKRLRGTMEAAAGEAEDLFRGEVSGS